MYRDTDHFIDCMGGDCLELQRLVKIAGSYEAFIACLPYEVDANCPVVRAFYRDNEK